MSEMADSNIEELRERIRLAVFDPGHAGEGYKGDRSLAEWQYDAVMRVIETLNSCKDCAGDWERMKAAAILAERERCIHQIEAGNWNNTGYGRSVTKQAIALIRGEA